MARLAEVCFLALVSILLTVAQECGNSGGDCPSITNIAQCTAEVVAVCCTKCTELAGCSNVASNCYSDYRANSCYQPEVRSRCCQMCKHFQKDYLGSSCTFGDLEGGCALDGCGIAAQYDETCCETCYSGTTPSIANVTVAIPETTTGSGPDLCTDSVSSCADTIKNVPSTCYNEDLRERCCASCAAFVVERATMGYDVGSCPYGDRSSHCLPDRFDTSECSLGDNEYLCCDSCNAAPGMTTAAPCEDSQAISCNLDSSFCYSEFYEQQCCATCRSFLKPDLDYTCRYGDTEDQCDSLISYGQVCSALELSVCCETCAKALLTTTPDPCQDESPSCGLLVGGIARNCYELEDFCCSSCRPLIQQSRPESCKYGDQLPICTLDTCDELKSQCCATCTDRPPPTTTRPPCSDASDQCMNGIYNLANEPEGCYRSEVRDDCCNSCRMLEVGNQDCLYGNRESLCSQLSVVDCTNPSIQSICCGECGGLVTSQPMSTPDLPPDCEDQLDTCEQLTEESLYSCYEGEFLASQCCASCYRKRKEGLPEDCEFGDRIQSCSLFLSDSSLCMQDAAVREDCCETCYSFETTTAPTEPTICPNVYGDMTCETLLQTLEGDCSSIQEVCCRTCYSTTTSAPTTVMTTTEACEDNFGSFACGTIITNEGEDQCYTDYVVENCCATCRSIITTAPPTTTSPVCPGDALPNCADIQALVADDICEDMSSFRQSCCEFCGDNESPPTTMGTTTLPPGCDGNIWSMDVCAASVATSPLDDPCEDSDLIYMNCCAYCSMVTTVTMTTRTTTPSGPICNGDNPAIDCASLDALPSFDVCTDDSLSIACCDFCKPTTTAGETTTRGGPCSFNVYSQNECQSLVDSSNGLICATDLMIENCCLFCTQLTFPPTTTTEAPCLMDNPDLNCTDLDNQFGGNLCTDLVNPLLRDECCFYCDNLPTTTTTGPPTTTICVDVLDELSCIAVANIGTCDQSFGLSQCCATCAAVNAPTTTESTTTTTTMTTVPCIDTGVLNCTALAIGGIVDPCTAEDAVRQACCAFCQNRTTLAPPITPGPCFGNSFSSDAVCINRESTDPDFCSTDPLWLSLCCEYCGAPVIQETTTGAEATTVTTTTPEAITGTTPTPAECNGNNFALVLCDNALSNNPERCEEELWYSQCCDYCDNLAAQQSRRRRSIESENMDSLEERALDLSRVRRQTPTCVTEDEVYCEEIIYNSNTEPKALICAENFFPLQQCCEYCARVSNEGAIPRDCQSDSLPRVACLDIIEQEGEDRCQDDFMSGFCCLTCALVALRTEDVKPATSTTSTTTATTTSSIGCMQRFGNKTCTDLLSRFDCSHQILQENCCDFYCPDETTQTTARMTETTTRVTQPPTTSTSTTTLATTTVYTDPPPACGTLDNAQTCSRFAYSEPSGCYTENVFRDCCETCTEYYYERQADGYNTEMCAYGNRQEDCSPSVDCTDPENILNCCDVCFPKMDTVTRPVVDSVSSGYIIILTIGPDFFCTPEYENPASFDFITVGDSVIAGVRSIFSILPGNQAYGVLQIRCGGSTPEGALTVQVVMSTPATHTFNELLELFNDAISDESVGIYSIDESLSSFHHTELYDPDCAEDLPSNCDDYAVAPNSECYDVVAYERCCSACNALGRSLYADRKYIPADCKFGDKEMECSASNVNCSLPEVQVQCCHTCAVEPEYYNVSPETTTVKVTTTSTAEAQITTSTMETTSTSPICTVDTSDRCDVLTRNISNCYDRSLVYDICCKSCDDAALWYLPADCAWGDRSPACRYTDSAQCSEDSVRQTCCEKCGTPLTSTSPSIQTSPSTPPTTTTPCEDTVPNCASLITLVRDCYDVGTECCHSCASKIIDYLPLACQYGDRIDTCDSISQDDCDDSQISLDCCQTCEDGVPTTTTAIASSRTSLPTTTTTPVTNVPTTTASTVPTTSTTDPGCVADSSVLCPFAAPMGCYVQQILDICCDSCASHYDENAPANCEYGDRKDYCSSVTTERCLAESRVFTDCCKTCDGLVAPPGTCMDTSNSCVDFTTITANCYSDLVYSQCCETCDRIASDDLGPTCLWGDRYGFCSDYTRDDCDTTSVLPEQCCELCLDSLTTTPAPTTTMPPQCIDKPSANCQQDTSEPRFCYDEGVAEDCCATCRILALNADPMCPYGDREEWCEYFDNAEDKCSEDVIRESCCQLCAPPTTTPMPTTSPCYDLDNCTYPVWNCYEDRYRDLCCASCMAAFDRDALFGCEYGDRLNYCQYVSRDQCLELEPVQKDCCQTCPELTAATSTSSPTGTSTTTSTSTTTTPPTTQTPECEDSDDALCSTISSDDCYSESTKERCCQTCRLFERNEASCLYGDKNLEFCSSSADCTLSVIRDLCCETCSGFNIPGDVNALYQLKINVTSLRCTVGLNDRNGGEYATFKFNMEKAVNDILVELPGMQLSELSDITCGSVLAILEIRSSGFYDLVEMNRFIMMALSVGTLSGFDSTYSVSVTGSSFRAISFEAPSCVSGPFSLHCLTDFVLAEPSKCYEEQVRSQCCLSCSSLFYARLAAAVDMDVCPYGDRDLECFTSPLINCYDEDARSRCCDRCADVSTTLPPTTTSTAPPTTTSSPVPCVDDNTDLCVQAVQNSLTFCYTEENVCCATCASRKIGHLPDECAWGNQAEICSQSDKSACGSDVINNSTCCELCGDYDISPTVQPCAGDDDANFDCSLILLSPSLCYNSDYYSSCCQTCGSVQMDYLPAGCQFGDKAQFCDSTSVICAVYGDDLCCASCCTDCQSPSPSTSISTSTSTSTTTMLTTTEFKPDGCYDLIGSCDDLIAAPMSCYSQQIYSTCCHSCFNLRRTDLPDSCSYGDKLSTCSDVTLDNCTDASNMASELCCGTCYDLLDISCNATEGDLVSNCYETVNIAGACYSQDVLIKCCASCKAIAIYTLSEECIFGDKVNWCGDITDDNRDRICSDFDNRQQCCETCKDYMGMSSTSQSMKTMELTTTTTTMATTTRLPPNEECPLGDVATNCTKETVNTGSCYDPAVAEICCRTCYELWKEDLPYSCRYGDKAHYCLTTSAEEVDYDWCTANGETCCSRCAPYLTTTVPTTTLPAQCPTGNKRDDCPLIVIDSFDCYSPVREEACCIQCADAVKPYLPEDCKYGDKAAFCQEIRLDECAQQAETCCEKCASARTTAAATLTPETTMMVTTARQINRVLAKIGRQLFVQPVPPKDSTLFSVSLTLAEACQQVGTDMMIPDSLQFRRKEEELCLDLSQKLWSMTHCYMEKVDCSVDAALFYTFYILVDRSTNYDNLEFGASKLRNEITEDGAIEEEEVLVSDVNECNPPNTLLANGCSDQAECTNTEGLYTCECPADMLGDGFMCQFKIDPIIGVGSFVRSTPPGYQYLYQLQLTINYTANTQHNCFNGMNSPTSDSFRAMESLICSTLGDALLSLYACYIDDFVCDNVQFEVTAHIIIDGSINYANNIVTASAVKNELTSYNGQITAGLVQDIDECSASEPQLMDGCHDLATCYNSPGLYACSCNAGYSGDGFISCQNSTIAPEASTQLDDWSIALIVVACVILLVAIIVGLICCTRYGRNKDTAHQQLTEGDTTPPRLEQASSNLPLYNSMRSTYDPKSEYAESYFFAQQEKELPGYTHKTYNVASNVPDDTTVFQFD